MKYRWGIPSYQRADAPLTVDLLRSLGYGKADIIVSTQTEEDFAAYQASQGDRATVVYAPARNDSENRNNTLKRFKPWEAMILADDDISSLCRLSADGKRLVPIEDGAELERLFDLMFSFCYRNNALMWAWYPVPNAFFMKRTIDRRNILCGTIFGLVNDELCQFNGRYALKGDYELALRHIARGMNAVRFNGFTCVGRHRSKGGCEEFRKRGENDVFCKSLLANFGDLLSPSHRDGEIRFHGKTDSVPEEVLFS